MTFVPQPFERFVDDLLTALTGGVTREEHQFVDAEKAYHLTTADALPASIKVFGQAAGQFVLFDARTDYIFDQVKAALQWNSQGKLPDDHSYFYVNYYRRDALRRLTDRNPGSVTTTMAEAFAREFAVLHRQMDMIYRSAFVDLATGASLDHVAALLSVERKDPRYATGEVLFKRNSPAPGDISIPAGTVVSTADGRNFETTDKRTLREGQLAVVAPVRAQLAGLAGEVDVGKITLIHRPIFGVETVTNDRRTFFASQKESDDELRNRIKSTLERAGRSTVDAIRYALIEDVEELDEGNIRVTEQADAPGMVEVKLGLTGDEDLARRVEASIFNARAAGIRVTHNLRTRTAPIPETPPMASGAAGQAWNEAAARMKAARPPQPEAPGGNGTQPVLPVTVEVFLRLSEVNLSVLQKEQIMDGVRAKVAAYVQGLPMGAALVYNKLVGEIVAGDQIEDAELLVRAAGSPDAYRVNVPTGDRKAELKELFVGLMEETVWVTVMVMLEPVQAGDITSDVTPELRSELNAVVDAALAAARAQGARATLTRRMVRDGIGVALPRIAPHLQLVQGDAAVTLNAEYEENGRLLNDADAIDLEEHQVSRRRKEVEVRIPGVLDGQV